MPGFDGRLTLVSGAPVMSGDVTSQTLWYAPHTGNTADGITFTSGPTDAAGPSLSLAGLPGGVVYKVFLASSGAIYLGSPPAGRNYGAGDYGAGVYPGHDPNPPLSRLNGILVNSAGDAYLGSIQIDPCGGCCTAHFSYGPSRMFGVWNAYNQVPIRLKAGHISPVVYAPFTEWPVWGPIRGDNGSSVQILTGLPQAVSINLRHTAFVKAPVMFPAGLNSSAQHWTGIGWNSTDTPVGPWGSFTHEIYNWGLASPQIAEGFHRSIDYVSPPFEGCATVYGLESAAGYVRAWAGEQNMALTAEWMG